MYKYFKIKGGNKLSGSVRISGAKNSALPILIATALANDKFTIEDLPEIEDVKIIFSILERMGSIVNFSDKKEILIDNTNLIYKDLMYEDVSKLRASYYFIGAFLGKYGKVKILLPGGCFLGPRPIDLHIKGFQKMGCEIKEIQNGNQQILEITAPEKGLKASQIFLDFPSVGATINLMLAAVNIEGETIIENAAKEPEIVDVATLLTTMGAKIKGAGTDVLKIKGVSKFSGCYHQVIPDRIEAGTYLMIGSLLAEDLTITNVIPEHLDSTCSKLREIGISMEIGDDFIKLGNPTQNLVAVNIKTGVHPSFPTDLQQIITTLLTQVEGESKVIDNIYPDRFRNCEHLNNMGAKIITKRLDTSGEAIIEGKQKLKGTEVIATDLRAGAGLVFAGLLAEGVTKIFDVNHILRGYDNIVGKLNQIGGDIQIIEEENR